MNRILAALLLSLALWGSAHSQTLVNVQCYPTSVAEDAATKAAVGMSDDLIDLDGAAAQRYLDVINAEPPITAMKAARIMLVPHLEGGPTLVVFLQSAKVGCIAGRVKPALHIRGIM